jgi:L-threonylcarbamoyladenylate synthase
MKKMKEIGRAVKALEMGELVVYPTETLYGLGADAADGEAVKRVFLAKKRPFSNPISIAVGSFEMLYEVAELNQNAKRIAREFLPGPITLILKSKWEFTDLLSRDGNVGIRFPKNSTAIELINGFGRPITSTSANLYNGENPSWIEQAKSQIGNKATVYLDGGLLGGSPSTVVDLTEPEPKILRESVISMKSIRRVIGEEGQ